MSQWWLLFALELLVDGLLSLLKEVVVYLLFGTLVEQWLEELG